MENLETVHANTVNRPLIKGTNTCWREDGQHCDNGGDSAMFMGENEPRYNPGIFES